MVTVGLAYMAEPAGANLSDRLGQQFVIENQTGGGGTIASYTLANAKPDGYTIIFQSSSSAAVVPAVSKNLRYDPIKGFAPVSLVAPVREVSVVLVSMFGALVLREGRAGWRVGASVVVVAGLVLMAS